MRFALETPRLSLRLRDREDAEWNLELLAEHSPPDLAFGLEEMRERLWATVRPWNAASFRVLEKVGFVRDHVVDDDQGELVYLRRELR